MWTKSSQAPALCEGERSPGAQCGLGAPEFLRTLASKVCFLQSLRAQRFPGPGCGALRKAAVVAECG